MCVGILTGAWLLHLLPVSACLPGSVLVLFLSLQCPGVARGFPGQHLRPDPQGPCAGTDLRVVLPPAPVGPAWQSWRPCWVLPEVPPVGASRPQSGVVAKLPALLSLCMA